jgi:aspartate/methionine/tyrosine aminotransferase
MTTSNRLAGIEEYYFSHKLREIEELNKQGKNIINLGIGSPDLPPHPEVIRILQEESSKPNVHGYQSYKGSPLLRNAIAKWYHDWYCVDLDPDSEILPLIGSKEGIVHICMTYFENGRGVLVPNPGYPTYSSAVRLSEATPIYYELKEENNYFPDFNHLDHLVKKNAGHTPVKGIFVNYPHMPTGQLPERKVFEQIIDFARRHGILVIHDNPYSFILNDHPMSLLSVQGAKEFAIELNSLSKASNMAGWRVGMLISSRKQVDEVLRFKSNMDSGMFLPVQLAAAKALSLEKKWYEDLNGIYRNRREKARELMDLLNCSYSVKQAGLFVWARVPNPINGFDLSNEVLYNANVFISPGGIFGSAGENYLRVSLCTPEERFIESIRRIKEYLSTKTVTHV